MNSRPTTRLACAFLAVLLIAGCASTPTPPPVAPASQTAEPLPSPAESAAATEARLIATVDDENSIFFAPRETELDPADKLKLQVHAERLRADTKLRVRLIGQTDSLGSHSYNLAISEKRITAVHEELRNLKVKPRQILRSNLGSEMADKSCRSTLCRDRMRRVEIRYLE